MNCCLEDHEIEALLNETNDSTFLDSIRSRRLEEICKIDTKTESSFNDSNDTWGTLNEIGHEKEVMHLSTSLPRLLIHFYNPAFKNCQVLNEHLQKLARKFPATRFVYIEATKSPFLIVKMNIQVLPCLIAIVDSLVVDRMVGFDDLGGTDLFTTKQLEDRLASQSRIFHVPLRFKKSADRRDRNSEDEQDDSDY